MSRLSFWAMSIAILLLTQPCFAQDPERKGKGKPSDGVILNANATYTPDKQMLIDSNITEWRGVEEIAFGPLLSGEYEYDWTGLKDLSVKLRVSYGMEKLYFLIQVKDNAVVARRRPWKSDMVELWLLSETHPIKANKGLVGLSFDMGPLTEDQPPTLRWISVAKKGIPNILSATIKLHDGYDIEMAVPFSEFTTLSPVMEGSIRFCVIVRDWDQDDPNEDEVVMASCKVNPKSSSKLKAADMGQIKFNLAEQQWAKVLESSLGGGEKSKLDFETKANVVGDAQLETIGLKGRRLIAAGYGFQMGQLSWAEYGFDQSVKINKMESKNINGDAYDEILVYATERCPDSRYETERVHVLQYEQGNFVVSSRIQIAQWMLGDATKRVTNKLQFSKKGIDLRLDTVELNGESMQSCGFEPMAGNIDILLPQDGKKTKSTSFSEANMSYVTL